jgi:hypothetical protein
LHFATRRTRHSDIHAAPAWRDPAELAPLGAGHLDFQENGSVSVMERAGLGMKVRKSHEALARLPWRPRPRLLVRDGFLASGRADEQIAMQHVGFYLCK